MGARWLQQKVLKQKRMRRAWAKKYSMKNVGPSKSMFTFNDQGKPTDVGMGARGKAARTNINFDSMSKFLLRRFKPSDTEVIYARTHGLHTDLASDRQVVLAKMTQSTGNAGSVQGETPYVYSVIKKIPNQELRLYMCRDSAFFVRETITDTERVFRVSTEYVGDSARYRAKADYVADKIPWEVVERTPLP
jgi:hypothetical protein